MDCRENISISTLLPDVPMDPRATLLLPEEAKQLLRIGLHHPTLLLRLSLIDCQRLLVGSPSETW